MTHGGTGQRWNSAELQLLDTSYPNADAATLPALLPGRTPKAIRTMANKRGLRRVASGISTLDRGRETQIKRRETEQVQAIYRDGHVGVGWPLWERASARIGFLGGETAAEIGLRLGRSEHAVRGLLHRIGVRRRRIGPLTKTVISREDARTIYRKAGRNYAAAAKIIGISANALREYLNPGGRRARKQAEARRAIKNLPRVRATPTRHGPSPKRRRPRRPLSLTPLRKPSVSHPWREPAVVRQLGEGHQPLS